MVEAGRGDADGQRQESAELEHVQDGEGLLVGAFADDAAEHGDGVRRGEDVHGQGAGAVQIGEPAPAGDQGEAPGRAGEQVPHVLGVGRVVEDQQHPAAGEFRAPERGPPGQVGGDAVGGDADLAQQDLQRRDRVERPLAHRVGAEIDEQPAVGIAAGEPVSGVDRQRRLADAGHPVDRVDHSLAGPAGQMVELAVAAGEVGEVVGEERHLSHRCPGRVAGQDLPFQGGEGTARVEALLVGEPRAEGAGDGERVGLPPGEVEGAHEVAGELLAQRMRRGLRDQLVDEVLVAAEGEFELGEPLERRQAALGQPRPGVGGVVGGDVGERLTAPQGQSGADPLRVLGGRQRRGELVQVQLPGLRDDHVSGVAGLQHVRGPGPAEHPPDRGDGRVDLGTGRLRGRRPPHGVAQAVVAEHGPGVEQQIGQHRTVPGRQPVQPGSVDGDLDRAENREPHPHAPRPRFHAHRQRIANLSVPFRSIVGMQGLPLIDPDTATGAARAQLTAARRVLGVTPNLARAMAHNPPVLAGYLAAVDGLRNGRLTPGDQAGLALLAAQHHRSEYALSMHAFLAEKVVGLTAPELTAARRGEGSPALAYAATLLRGGAAPGSRPLPAQVAEVVAHLAVNHFTSCFTTAAHVPLDWPRVALP
nr:hypothetical protein GCM10020093_082620 [Planobispora longispora]